jgi:alpha-D-ribose 1-methylphosphonate 5-triphosphate synthase subunit PhnH
LKLFNHVNGKHNREDFQLVQTQTGWQQRQEQQIFYSTATFRSLLDSLARPGKINKLAYPTLERANTESELLPNMYALGALATLLDSEVSFVLAEQGQWLDQRSPASQWLIVRSGSRLAASPSQADFAFFSGGSSNGLISTLNPGDLLEPEISTTAFYTVESLAPTTEAALPLVLTLKGPGIADTTTFGVAGLAESEIALIQATRHNYPLGIDIYLIDAAGQCVGLPRTTRLVSSKY